MNVKMYGRAQGCKFCDRAKLICEMNGFELEFIDIEAQGLSAADLAEVVGIPVRTVPQIFVDEQYVGGCDKFEAFLKGE